jgi:2-polyprenyl-6-hydroxyphenyl methylase/3-demethylubiquinone-9 3-methyltransferase
MRRFLRRMLSRRTRERLRRVWNLFRRPSVRDEVDTLYGLLYHLVHDREEALQVPALQTEQAFAYQWENLPEGFYLLSDPWFKANLPRILSEEELQLRAQWFRGKAVLDAGCGNGRWAFGLAQLGAQVTAVDVNQSAIDATAKALMEVSLDHQLFLAPLEQLSGHLPPRQYDLVFCWGVLHHCRSFNKAFEQVVRLVKPGGLLYIHLYGRESLSLKDDVNLFKRRLRFHLMSLQEKQRFLLKQARGDGRLVHNLHDLYGPLINRRFEFDEIRERLQRVGFSDVTRTIQHTELHIRAVKGDATEYRQKWFLPLKEPPYWFHHH